MNRTILYLCFILLLSSFSTHKFYVSIYQVEHNELKKRVEITSRVFIDDLTECLEKKFKAKISLDQKSNENNHHYLKNYFSEKFSVKINNEQKQLIFKSYEIEENVVVCYFSIQNISKIKSMSIENSALMEIFSEQQNIIQAKFNNNKRNLVLTIENSKGVLK